jgi:hypothetical protein
MATKDIQQIVDEMIKKASNPDPHILAPGGGPASGEPSQVEILAMVIQRIEMGMNQLAQSQQSYGIALDASRLTIQLLVRMMAEKNVFSEDEFKERYETDVVEKMNQMQKQMQEQYEKHMKEQKNKEEKTPGPIEMPTEQDDSCDCGSECKKCSEEDSKSDVVLPSERKGKVIKFPSK